jgi:hypothetical protein
MRAPFENHIPLSGIIMATARRGGNNHSASFF